MNVKDPISREMKTVAVAIYGEKLEHKTTDADVAIENVATAVAALVWPEDEGLRRRFIAMCLSEVTIEHV